MKSSAALGDTTVTPPLEFLNSFSNRHQNIKAESGGIMARLNIEDEFFLDIADVVAKVGDQDRAIGNAVRFLRHAQEKHKKGHLISEAEFKKKGFLEALIPHFAERVDGGIQAVGSAKHFDWLKKRVEAGSKGGKKSAGKRKNKHGEDGGKQNEANESKQEQAEPSPSPSFSSSPTDSRKNSSSSTKKASAQASLGTNDVIALYSRLWKDKYQGTCDIFGPDAGILARMVKSRGAGRIADLIISYFENPDKWYLQNRHDLFTFQRDIKKISHFADTGAFVNRRKVLEEEEKQHFETKYQTTPEDQLEISKILNGSDQTRLLAGGK